MNVLNIYSSKGINFITSMKNITMNRRNNEEQLIYTSKSFGKFFAKYRQESNNDFLIYLIPLNEFKVRERPIRLIEVMRVCDFALDLLSDEDEILKERLLALQTKLFNIDIEDFEQRRQA